MSDIVVIYIFIFPICCVVALLLILYLIDFFRQIISRFRVGQEVEVVWYSNYKELLGKHGIVTKYQGWLKKNWYVVDFPTENIFDFGMSQDDLKSVKDKFQFKQIKSKKGGFRMPKIFRWAIYLSVTLFLWRFFTSIDVNLIFKVIYKLLGVNI